jgi:hypothetical protein
MAHEMRNAVVISLNHSKYDTNASSYRRHAAPRCSGEISASAMPIRAWRPPHRAGLYALCANATDSKTGHCRFQTKPPRVERGQYPIIAPARSGAVCAAAVQFVARLPSRRQRLLQAIVERDAYIH